MSFCAGVHEQAIQTIEFDNEMEAQVIKEVKLHPGRYYSTSCLICGESVALTSDENLAIEYNKPIGPKVCEGCRSAIIKLKESQSQEDAKYV